MATKNKLQADGANNRGRGGRASQKAGREARGAAPKIRGGTDFLNLVITQAEQNFAGEIEPNRLTANVGAFRALMNAGDKREKYGTKAQRGRGNHFFKAIGVF